MEGVARVEYRNKDGETRLGTLEQRSPLRVLFPRPDGDDIPTAAIANTSGGVAGGDSLLVRVRSGPGARARVIGSAAEKIYRSGPGGGEGRDSTVDTRLVADSGAWLEWLPQETILFDGARLRRRTVLDVADGAGLLAGECLVFGRLAHGEVMRAGRVFDAWEVRRRGRPVWRDVLRMDDPSAALDEPAALAGARAAATIVYAGEDAAELGHRGQFASSGAVKSGATVVHGVMVVRMLGAEPAPVRSRFAAAWMEIREQAAGLPGRMPRLWHM